MTQDNLSFGPKGAQWQYSRTEKTYDLTRSNLPTHGDKKYTIETTQGPCKAIAIDPEISALVIIDMQNFFLSPRCRDHPLGLKAVEPTIAAIERAREIGMKVIWVNWGLTETDIANLPAGVQRGFSRDLIAGTNEAGRSGLGSELGDGKGRCLMAGSWNAAIYDPLLPHALPEDIYCDKNRMSGLWNEEQPLWKALDRYGVKTCFFTGVNTDQCVGGTLSNAYNAGWDCVLIDDCCGTPTVYGRDVWVYNIAASYGFVVDSRTFCSGSLTT